MKNPRGTARVGLGSASSRFVVTRIWASTILHLVEREGHTQTPAHTAAERRPLVGIGALAEEALGAKLEGFRVQVGPPMHHAECVCYGSARRNFPVAQAPRLLHDARASKRHDGTKPQDLLDRRVEELQLRKLLPASRHPPRPRHTRDFVADSRDDVGTPQETLESPAEGRTGRLVSRQDHRRQLVTQLRIRQAFAFFVAGDDQHRQDVCAILRIARFSSAPDLVVQQSVRVLDHAYDASPGAQRSQIPLERACHQQRRRDDLVGEPHELTRDLLVSCRAVVETEDRPQDHLKCDALQLRMDWEDALAGP